MLPGFWKTGQPTQLAQAVHLSITLGEDLVGVTLVAHIKYQPVRIQIKYPMDGHRGLHHPQAGGQMAACPGDAVHDPLPQTVTQHSGLQIRNFIEMFRDHGRTPFLSPGIPRCNSNQCFRTAMNRASAHRKSVCSNTPAMLS